MNKYRPFNPEIDGGMPLFEIQSETEGNRVSTIVVPSVSTYNQAKNIPWYYLVEEVIVEKGGSGSGNFGHTGRPGEVGGSAPVEGLSIDLPNEAFLSIDVNSVVMRHTTTHAEEIQKNGFGFSSNSMYGTGIYFSTQKFPSYGDKTLEISLHPHTQLVIDADIHVPDVMKSMGINYLDPEMPKKMSDLGIGSMRFPVDSDVYTVVFDHNLIDIDGITSSEDNSILKQLPISEVSKQNLIKIRTNMFADEVNALAERMFTGDITLGSWEEAMKKMIRELHTSTAAIGKGGWDQMTPADWGRLGPVLKGQYKYLHGFAQYVEENKDTVSLKAIQARARMYGNAGAFSSVVVQAGDVISKKLPWLPKDGSTECLVNCKCFWKLDIVGTEVMKGGEGSGNFGHAGREGEVGGSAPTGGSISYAEKAKDYQISNTSQMERDPFAGIQRGFITEEGILLDAKKYSHEKFADEILNVDANAVSDQNREWLDKLGLEQIDNPEVTAIMDGLTRIHILRDEIAITTKLMDTPTLHRIQKYFTSGIIKRPLDSSVSWSGYLFNYPVDVNPATVSTGIHMTWREFIAMDKVGYDARDNQIILRESVEEYIEKQLPTGDWVDVQCVWHLRPAEHCKTCVGRNNHVELIRVHRTVPIPSVIG